MIIYASHCTYGYIAQLRPPLSMQETPKRRRQSRQYCGTIKDPGNPNSS